jgi:16S rRNA processing protein RimM
VGRVDPGFLVVGHLARAHGIHGELYVWPLTDHPEGTFTPGVVLRLGDREGREPDADLPPLRIAAVRPFQDGWLVTFGGVESRSEAEVFRGRYLMRAVDEVAPLEEGEVFYHQLLGSDVYTVDGTLLGRVAEVYELAPSDLLEVRGEGRTYMIPFRAEVVVEVDPEGGRVVVDPPDGLLDL